MIAITIFMGTIPAWARFSGDRAFSTEVHHAEKVTTRAQPQRLESNAVPDHPHSLTDYERGPFRGLRHAPETLLLGRAQTMSIADQKISRPASRHNRAHDKGS